MSRRILFASIFGIGGILIALFINSHTAQEGTPQDTTRNAISTTTSATSSLSLTPLDWLAGTTTASDKPLSETDQLTRNVLGPYFEATTQGTYTAATADSIVKNATADALTLVYTPLTSSVIQATEATSTARVLAYKEELQEALAPVFALEEYELTIYARATERNSAEDFAKLSQYAQTYRTTADALKDIRVPKDAAAIHLNILNSMYHFAVMLDALSAGFDDPARSLSGIGNFNAIEAEFSRSFANLRTYFVLKDVAE